MYLKKVMVVWTYGGGNCLQIVDIYSDDIVVNLSPCIRLVKNWTLPKELEVCRVPLNDDGVISLLQIQASL